MWIICVRFVFQLKKLTQIQVISSFALHYICFVYVTLRSFERCVQCGRWAGYEFSQSESKKHSKCKPKWKRIEHASGSWTRALKAVIGLDPKESTGRLSKRVKSNMSQPTKKRLKKFIFILLSALFTLLTTKTANCKPTLPFALPPSFQINFPKFPSFQQLIEKRQTDAMKSYRWETAGQLAFRDPFLANS